MLEVCWTTGRKSADKKSHNWIFICSSKTRNENMAQKR